MNKDVKNGLIFLLITLIGFLVGVVVLDYMYMNVDASLAKHKEKIQKQQEVIERMKEEAEKNGADIMNPANLSDTSN